MSTSVPHGCIRLTNWDAAELAKLVTPGVKVSFVDSLTSLN
jgi:lipoprotein-anchoring transpeptidase ErfK/SrfK